MTNLKMYTTDTEKIIAESPEGAIEVWNDLIGDDYVKDGYGELSDWQVMPGDFVIPLTLVDVTEFDGSMYPKTAKLSVDENGFVVAEATVGEWCAHAGKSEYFASTEW